jgi:predicted ferric reductase
MKRRRSTHTVFWSGLYVLLVLAPLSFVLGSLPPGRGFWVEFGAGLGFVAFTMLVLQFVLTARFRGVGAPYGLDAILQFHRQAGLAAVVFALLHPVFLMIGDARYVEFLDPRVMFPRAAALAALTAALLLIVGLTFWRRCGFRKFWPVNSGNSGRWG